MKTTKLSLKFFLTLVLGGISMPGLAMQVQPASLALTHAMKADYLLAKASDFTIALGQSALSNPQITIPAVVLATGLLSALAYKYKTQLKSLLADPAAILKNVLVFTSLGLISTSLFLNEMYSGALLVLAFSALKIYDNLNDALEVAEVAGDVMKSIGS